MDMKSHARIFSLPAFLQQQQFSNSVNTFTVFAAYRIYGSPKMPPSAQTVSDLFYTTKKKKKTSIFEGGYAEYA